MTVTVSLTFVLIASHADAPLHRGMEDSGQKPVVLSPFVVGAECFARRDEDGQYYKAVITDVVAEAASFVVVFVGFGSKQICRESQLCPLPGSSGTAQRMASPSNVSYKFLIMQESNRSVEVVVDASWSLKDLKVVLHARLGHPKVEDMVLCDVVGAEIRKMALLRDKTRLHVYSREVWEAILLVRDPDASPAGVREACTKLPSWQGDLKSEFRRMLNHVDEKLEFARQRLRLRAARFGLRQQATVSDYCFMSVVHSQLLSMHPELTELALLDQLQSWSRDHDHGNVFGAEDEEKMDVQIQEVSVGSWSEDVSLLAVVEHFRVSVLIIQSAPSARESFLDSWFRVYYPKGAGPADGLPQICIGHESGANFWALSRVGMVCFQVRNQVALSIQFWDHKKPHADTHYFSGIRADSKPTLAIGVAFYNEPPCELQRSLVSLARQQKDVEGLGFKVQTVFVSDGHREMDPDSLLYLKALFCKDDKAMQREWDNMRKMMDEHAQLISAADRDPSLPRPPGRTFIVEKLVSRDDNLWDLARINVELDAEDSSCMLQVVLVLKVENRRKHNSGQWMMSPNGGFARMLDADYLLLSDCGTLFKPKCISQLVDHMTKHPMCVGSTARQRVMWADEQNLAGGFLEGFCLASLFRLVQLVDYEASYAVYNGAFSLVGCLPVLPGPCTLLRYDNLIRYARVLDVKPLSDIARLAGEEEAVNSNDLVEPHFEDLRATSPYSHFEEVVETEIAETDIVIENVKIAEDRVPSYSIVTHGSGAPDLCTTGPYTTWVTGCSSWGPVFKFQAETEIVPWLGQRRRWINGAFATYVWMCLVNPGLILKAPNLSLPRRFLIYLLSLAQLLNYSVATMATSIFGSALYLSLLQFNVEEWVTLTLCVAYIALMLLFGWVHRYTQLVKWLFYLTSVVNTALVVFVLFALIYGVVNQSAVLLVTDISVAIVVAAFAVLLVPFILSLLSLDFVSFFLLLVGFIPYVLFLPTLIGVFTVYAIARLGDTSWGNRLSSVGSGFIQDVNAKQIEKLSVALNANAGVALAFLSLFNVVGFLLVILLRKVQGFLLGVILLIVATIGIQAILSAVFFVGHHTYNLFTCNCCCQKKRVLAADFADGDDYDVLVPLRSPSRSDHLSSSLSRSESVSEV